MSTTPATPGLQIVGYGVENSRPTEHQPMMLLMHDTAGAQYPELCVPLVCESDALAAIKDLRIERDKLLAERYDLHGVAKGLHRTIEALTNECAALRAAANALVERWDSPAWKETEHTGAFISRLRAAIATNGGEALPAAGAAP